MKSILIIIFCFIASLCNAQCPSTSFSLESANLCVGESIDIDNTSDTGLAYLWDFCSNDQLINTPSNSQIAQTESFDLSNYISIVQESGTYFGFVPSRLTNDKIVRLDFDNGIDGEPTFNDLGNIGNILDDPIDISLINDDGIWLALVTGLTSDKLYLLEFNNGITELPDISDISSGIGLSRPNSVKVVEEDGNYYAFIVNNEDGQFPFLRLDFGNSLLSAKTSTPTETQFDIVGSDNMTTISLAKECDSWYGIILSRDNGRIYRLSFGTSIAFTPSYEEVGAATGVSFDNPGGLEMIHEGDSSYAFVQSRNGPLYKMYFGTSFANAPTAVDLGNITGVSGGWGLSFLKEGSEWHGFNANFSSGGRIFRLDFPTDCSITGETSDVFEPKGISYQSDGTYNVTLYSYDSDGNSSSQSQAINVAVDIAPSISFTIDANQCISNSNTFTTSSPGITHSWDFDNDGFEDSNLENPTHQFLTTGTHTVRLDVNDGTCNNFIEQEITIYPEPPTPTFTALTDECVNTGVTFTNTTDETGFGGIITYDWDFNGENGTAITDASPTFTFTTPGTKQVTVTAQIPGCETTSAIFEIEISSGPTSAFTASAFSICETETINFTDQSTGSPVSFSWDFGDGFSSNSQNPDHLFATAGNYDVELTVTDALGCQNTITQEVAVAALPIVDFNFDIPCTSESGIQFMDESTVSGSDIATWNWFVDDVLTSTAEDPVLNFEMEGTVNIRLEAISLNGCSSTYSEDIEILATPEPDFSIDLGCDGEPSTFQDLTSSPGNPIGTWLWTLDGTNYSTQDISHTFSGPGIFEVTLEVTGQNFCSETVTHNVEILELPMVQFSVSGDCSNEIITAVDESTIDQDPIVSREWRLDGTSIGNGDQILLESLPGATYELELEVVTQSGCITNASQNLLVNSSPLSVFEPSKTFGLPGDQISFTNQSSGASGYQWLLDDLSLSTNVDQEIQFSEPGTYQVSLVASNDLGCNDTTTSEILIAIPEVDLSIGQFEVIDNNNTGSIFIEIQNNSNLPVEVTEVVVELENQFSVTEQVLSLIGIGESELVNLNVGIPLTVTQLSYLCVTLNSQYVDYPDLTPVDNEKCIAIQPDVVVEAPFPNPAIDQTRVKMVVPQAGVANLSIFNSSGKIEFSIAQNVTEGLNNFFIELNNLESGVYFVRLDFMGTSNVQRIVKL